MKPVCAPDPVEPPAEPLQDILTEPVALSCPEGGVICSPVAFHSEDIAARLVRVTHAQINLEPGRTDLPIARVAQAPDHI